MDLQRLMYGKVVFGMEQVSLGRGTINALLIRAATEIKSMPINIKRLAIEFNFDEITNDSELTRDINIEKELESGIIPVDEIQEEWKPGISYARMAEALEAESYKRYARLCTPANRIGVEEDTISTLRTNYQMEFPDVFDYLPIWRDS